MWRLKARLFQQVLIELLSSEKKEDANFIPHKKAFVCHGDDEHDADNGMQIEIDQYGQYMMKPPSHNGKQDKS